MNYLPRATFLILAIAAGCSSSGKPGGGGAGGNGGSGGSGGMQSPGNDFPSAPIIDPNGNTPPNAPTLFGPPTSGSPSGGPCLSEPPIGALLPQNFLRPRFSYGATGGQNLFEIRLHTAGETNDLVVYTTQTSWTMTAPIWTGLAAHVVDQPITVTVRGAVYNAQTQQLTSGPSLGSSGTITIAPASAPGAIVYWAQITATMVTALKGFNFGEETVHTVLVPNKVSGTAQCIACHTSTPDGMNVGFAVTNTLNDGRPSSVGVVSSDGTAKVPSYITQAGQTALARFGQTLPVFSKAHFATGDRIMISLLPNGPIMSDGNFPGYDLIWTDLESGASGKIARNGDNKLPLLPAWSHDGQNIVYVSGTKDTSGAQTADGVLRMVPYNNKAGGTSTAIAGASDPAYNQFFPSFSPDDLWIAFSRIPTGMVNYSGSNSASEVFIVPPGGGTATRLAANDPPSCGGATSPGVTNSWPKWAPSVSTAGTRTFYWLTFSSKRNDGSTPQLFVTPLVVDGGMVKTYPALYLWNQPATEGNHTPAWDNFVIPIG